MHCEDQRGSQTLPIHPLIWKGRSPFQRFVSLPSIQRHTISSMFLIRIPHHIQHKLLFWKYQQSLIDYLGYVWQDQRGCRQARLVKFPDHCGWTNQDNRNNVTVCFTSHSNFQTRTLYFKHLPKSWVLKFKITSFLWCEELALGSCSHN